MSDKRILCVGLMCVDIIQICRDYPKEDSDQRSIDHRWQRGGNASNNCTVLSKCGQVCEYFGTMSDDIMAEFAKKDFERHKIIIQNVIKHSKHDTPFSSVIMNSKNGSRTIIHSNKGMPELTLQDFKKLNLHEYNWIHFEGRNVNQVLSMLQYLKTWNASNAKITTSVELEKPREELKLLIPLADTVFVGKDFATFQGCRDKYEAENKISKLVQPSATVVVAWGESGAVGSSADRIVVESPAFLSNNAVDTLGAGDSFVAATVLALSQGRTLKASITTGCRVAGAKVTMAGFSAIHPGLLND